MNNNLSNKLTFLGDKHFKLVSDAIKTYGTFDHNEWMHSIEESLTVSQYHTVVAFMEWVNENDRVIDFFNISRVFAAFAKTDTRLFGRKEGLDYILTVFDESGRITDVKKSTLDDYSRPNFAKSIHNKLRDGESVVIQLSFDVVIKLHKEGNKIHYKRIDSSDSSIAQSVGSKEISEDGIAYCQYKNISIVEKVLLND